MYKLKINHDGRGIEPLTFDSAVYTIKKQSASTLEFSLYRDDVASFEEGDIVSFYNDDKETFYGRIINITLRGSGEATVTACDSLYYFKSRDSFNFVGQTLSQIVRKIVSDMNLSIGEVDESSHTIPFLCAPDSTLFGIIDKALYEEFAATGERYALLCDYDKISLKNVKNLRIPIIIDESCTLDFEKKTSIDSCYNRVKLSYADASNSIEGKYTLQDGELVEKWGILQYYEKINGVLNPVSRADELLRELKKKKTTFVIPDTKGDIRVKAGSIITLRLDALEIDATAYVASAVHKFKPDLHLMSLELEIE